MKEIVIGLTLMTALFVGVAVAEGAPPAPVAYNARVIHKAATSWNGQQIVYPPSKGAEVTFAEITIEQGRSLPWHVHEVPMYVYVLEGELTLEDTKGNFEVLPKGSAGIEGVRASHRGHATGDTDTKLIGIYLGSEGLKNTKLDTLR